MIIALHRLGVEVTAVDRYDGAPGHRVAHRARTTTMSDPAPLREVLAAELERDGAARVVPTARAARRG